MSITSIRWGTGGISTSPAPSRPRAERPLVRREPRDLEREFWLAEAGDDPADPDLAADPDGPAGVEPLAGGPGASPQVSQ